MSREKGVGM